MNAVFKTKTVDAIIGTSENIKYVVEPIASEAVNANDPVTLTLLVRLVVLFYGLTRRFDQDKIIGWIYNGDYERNPNIRMRCIQNIQYMNDWGEAGRSQRDL